MTVKGHRPIQFHSPRLETTRNVSWSAALTKYTRQVTASKDFIRVCHQGLLKATIFFTLPRFFFSRSIFQLKLIINLPYFGVKRTPCQTGFMTQNSFSNPFLKKRLNFYMLFYIIFCFKRERLLIMLIHWFCFAIQIKIKFWRSYI